MHDEPIDFRLSEIREIDQRQVDETQITQYFALAQGRIKTNDQQILSFKEWVICKGQSSPICYLCPHF